MARPRDPNSLSARIRECFIDGRSIVAYTVPDNIQLEAVSATLKAALPRLRGLVQSVRTQCAAEFHPDYYGQHYRADQHRAITAWADEDLACCWIGLKPELSGARRMRSVEECNSLAPGETGILSLFNRSERDTQQFFDGRSDRYWRESEGLAPGNGRFPVFEVRLAEPDKVKLSDMRADYFVTRRPTLNFNPLRTLPDTQVIEDFDPYAPTRAIPDPEPEAALWRDDDEPDEPLTP